MADLYAAELDGILLEIELLDDSFEKAIARHELPMVDGAILEDMGQKARVVNIACHFWDHADHLTYADHVMLLNHLESRELFQLSHPKYGPMQGKVERISVRHDDSQDHAAVELTFVEERRNAIDEAVFRDIEAGCEEAFLQGQEEQMDQFAADVQASLGVESGSLLTRALAEGQSILEQVKGLSATARAYVAEVDHFVAGLEAELTAIAQPANSLISTINYGLTLPGRVVGAVTRTLERYVTLYDSARNAPGRFIDNLQQALNHLEVTLGLEDTKKSHASSALSRQLKTAAAQVAALQLASIYKADESLRRSQKSGEAARSFDASGRYLAPSVPAVPDVLSVPLSLSDLESTLYAVRAMLDFEAGAVALPSSKALALQLLEHVNMVKLEREKMVPLALDNPMPLHLVCLKAGLPYQAAERLLSVNRIPRPCYVSGEVTVYAR